MKRVVRCHSGPCGGGNPGNTASLQLMSKCCDVSLKSSAVLTRLRNVRPASQYRIIYKDKQQGQLLRPFQHVMHREIVSSSITWCLGIKVVVQQRLGWG